MVEIIDGGITTPQGFKAAGVHSGVKYRSLDMGLLYSEVPATAYCAFTSNNVKAAPVQVMMEENSPQLQAVVVNRGLEPASGSVLFTGPDGQTLAERTFQNLTYGGTVIAEYEPDSFAALYGEDVTATVRLQQDEPNMLNNTDSVPVLLTSTEILSAQRGGSFVLSLIHI